MRRPVLFKIPTLILALTGLSLGCGPSQGELDSAMDEVRTLRGELEESQSARSEVEANLAQLSAQNDEMTRHLQALGQNVSELEGQNSELTGQNTGLAETLAETRRALEEYRVREAQAQERLAMFRGLLSRFQNMIDSGRLRIRIVRNRMVLELQDDILFAAGRDEVKEEGRFALAEVSTVLRDMHERHFMVAGHTDNIPIRTRRFPSNWALSTSRAVNVVEFFIEQGVDQTRLSAAGFADTQPVASNDTAEGRSQNRRIEIILIPNLDELPDLSSLEETATEEPETPSDEAAPAAETPAAETP